MARQLFQRTTTAFSSSFQRITTAFSSAYQHLVKAVNERRAVSGSGETTSAQRDAAKAYSARLKKLQDRETRNDLVRLRAPAMLGPLPEDMPLARSSAGMEKNDRVRRRMNNVVQR